MTFPSYITSRTLPATITPNYAALRLVSVVGGTYAEQIRALKLAAVRRSTEDRPLAGMRVYTDQPDTWRLTGFTSLYSLGSLAAGIAELPDTTIVDHLDTADPAAIEAIEHLKASVRPGQLLAVSYTRDHAAAHNADLVHWLDSEDRDAKTG